MLSQREASTISAIETFQPILKLLVLNQSLVMVLEKGKDFPPAQCFSIIIENIGWDPSGSRYK